MALGLARASGGCTAPTRRARAPPDARKRPRAAVAAASSSRASSSAAAATASAAATAARPPPTVAPSPPSSSSSSSAEALRDTWAYRLLSRVSLAAQRLEEIERASEKQQQQQQQQQHEEGRSGKDGGGAAASSSPPPPDVAAAIDRIFEDELEPIFMSRGGYRIPPRERRELDASGGSATYGEVMPAGVRAISRRALALDDAAALAAAAGAAATGDSADDAGAPAPTRPPPVVFVDLGCGTGRAVLQVAGEFGVARAVGVELGATRLEQAEAALDLLLRGGGGEGGNGRTGDDEDEDDGDNSNGDNNNNNNSDASNASSAPPPTLAPVDFVLADLATADLDALTRGQGTHFYACTTAFGAALCRSLAERLASRCPSFRALVTTRALPKQPHLRLLGVVDGVEYSWTGRGSAYVYARSAEDAPPELLARLWGARGGGGIVALPSASPLALVGLAGGDEPVAMAPATMAADAGRRDAEDDD